MTVRTTPRLPARHRTNDRLVHEISLDRVSRNVELLVPDRFDAQCGKATPHDVTVGKALAEVLSGGDTDITETIGEDDLLKLERDVFVAISHNPASVARVSHMLKTGKPLRN